MFRGSNPWHILGIALCLLTGSVEGRAQTNSLSTNSIPAGASVTNVLASFTLKPGFRLELVAQAPQVEAPMAMAFDEDGRLYVAEMRDYPSRRQDTPHLGRVRLLEDTNGTGRFESSTVFADDLPCPSALACYDGGVFVAATRDVLYLKDTAGSGTANVRQTVFSGFSHSNAPNAEVFLNNFNWGLDNRIHGATAGLGGIITMSNAPGSGPISLTGSDFSFEPRSRTLLPEAGPAQTGLCFDNRGRRFLSDFARPLRLPMYEPRYGTRNAYAPRPPQFLDVLSPATPVYRFVQPAAPKVAAPSGHGTNAAARVAAQSPVALAPAWLTKACGTVVYRGSAFPSNYLENVFIAEPAAHVIHRAVLHENGLEPTAGRAPDEATSEFLVSRDPSFHPMQIVNGPEGALYIADFGNGEGTGHIYRIVPEKFQRPEPPRLRKASPRDWVVALAQPDGWRRDTAARLLYQHPDPASVPLLNNMLAHSRLPLARLHALRALEGLGALRENHLLTALQDADYRVREHAVRLSEAALRLGLGSEALWAALTARAADPSICVRYQLAFTLGETSDRRRLPGLARLLSGDENRWMRAAALSSLAGNGAEVLVMLAQDPRFGDKGTQAELLEQLATMVGVEGNETQVNGLLEFIDRTPLEPARAFALLSALGEGLHRTRSSLALVDPPHRLARFYADAQRLAGSRDTSEPLRIQAIRLLSVSPLGFPEVGDTLLLCIGSGESPAIQAAVLKTLGRYDDPHIARALLGRWPTLPSDLRHQAITTLLAWTNRVPEVLNAVEAGILPREDLPPLVLNSLRTYGEAAVRQRAQQLLGPVPVHHSEAVQRFQTALGLRGIPSRGRELFRARCAECHALGGQGSPLGPDLSLAKVSGKEKLLLGILEPNARQRSGYAPSTIQTKPSELLLGLVRDENLKTFTVQQPGGEAAVWPRENVEFVQPQPWSFMPDDLTQGLSIQQMADLLDYLMTGP